MKYGLSEACPFFFAALSNPTRLAVVELLREGPRNVTQISKALGQSQSMISHNLQALVRCRFVLPERRWKERVYFLNRETLEPLFKLVDCHVQTYCPKKCSPRKPSRG
ncbi:metalloregulator ArsR/SmtB family transcription factor [Candidatus Hecatella orcuttiae]|jgi:DNA-binding transcriptional ArsR family regulator|uniref:ArsR/SmtB family transcription factor n=1 Tax=Candidatus Hecatella orcuttiae TaxID=1935119 RepID=UPI002868231A|nr:metalloregulator ArsR/SmtB family transcription factor [Candidatus Hecatella orcuttiae]